LLEKYARIGSRKISLEPPTTSLGLLGLIAIEVSLCGPSSLLASTFVRTDNGELTENGELPFSSFWYFAHQVGWVYEDAASADPAPTATTIAAIKPARQNLIVARKTPLRCRIISPTRRDATLPPRREDYMSAT
jgi:hypothetical protein